MRKLVFRSFNQIRHKLGCAAKENGLGPDILDLGSGRIGLISCAVTAQVICIFVFAYAKVRFSLITACMQIEHFKSEHLSAYLLTELQEYTKKENLAWSI